MSLGPGMGLQRAETAPQLSAYGLNAATGTPRAKTAEDQLAPVTAKLATHKKKINGRIAANQGMTAIIKTLQAEQRVLRQQVAASHTATHLFSEQKILQVNNVATGRRFTTGSVTSPASRRAETRNRAASKVRNALLALLPQ